ncbi:MAG: DUF2442 domain-containing protein [Arcobacter sp.]|nr:DUF2442 domain-containing protein [Arcobacter sp.]
MNTSIKSLQFADKIYVHLSSADILVIPYSYTKKLHLARHDELVNYRLIGGGIGVHFENIDEDISLKGIIAYKLENELKAS